MFFSLSGEGLFVVAHGRFSFTVEFLLSSAAGHLWRSSFSPACMLVSIFFAFFASSPLFLLGYLILLLPMPRYAALPAPLTFFSHFPFSPVTCVLFPRASANFFLSGFRQPLFFSLHPLGVAGFIPSFLLPAPPPARPSALVISRRCLGISTCPVPVESFFCGVYPLRAHVGQLPYFVFPPPFVTLLFWCDVALIFSTYARFFQESTPV